jgi:hypothetical protein
MHSGKPMPCKLDAELTRARALSMSLRQMLVCSQDLEDKHQSVGCAIFLADELDHQLERIEDAARGWKTSTVEGANDA